MNDLILPLHVRILQHELDTRKKKNSRYSMRALARDLDIDPAALSRILSGKQDMSLETCRATITTLKLEPAKARLFIASVAEDKRNRSAVALTRMIEPRYLSVPEVDRDLETIRSTGAGDPIGANEVIALEKDLVTVTDLEGRFLYVNEAVAKSLGCIPCELIGERWPPNALDIQDSNLLENHVQQAVSSRTEMTFEFSAGRHGNLRHLRRLVSPVFDADGKVTAVVSTIRDVTWDHFLVEAASRIHSSIDAAQVLIEAACVASPLLGEGCVILRKGSVIASHGGQESADYAKVAGARLNRFVKEGASRIEELPVDLSESLAFKNSVPVSAIVCPLGRGDAVIFLSSRRCKEFKRGIAEKLCSILSNALKNAELCSKS